MKYLFRGHDGKLYVADDHREDQVLGQIMKRIQAVLNKIQGEENDDRIIDNLPQRERKEKPDGN